MQLIAPPEGFVAPARATAGRRPAQALPALYPLAVWAHRCRRRVAWLRGGTDWAHDRVAEPLAHRVKAHASLLMRPVPRQGARAALGGGVLHRLQRRRPRRA